MFRLSTCIAAFALVFAATMGHAQIPASAARDKAPQRTILMFGASWCAPCVAELRNIAAIAAGARPDRIVIVWTDGDIGRFARGLPDNVELASSADARQMGRQYAKHVAGLPYNVMIGADGGKCAEMNAALSIEAIRQMRKGCDEAQH